MDDFIDMYRFAVNKDLVNDDDASKVVFFKDASSRRLLQQQLEMLLSGLLHHDDDDDDKYFGLESDDVLPRVLLVHAGLLLSPPIQEELLGSEEDFSGKLLKKLKHLGVLETQTVDATHFTMLDHSDTARLVTSFLGKQHAGR